jgi:hypothetical protein
MVEVFGAVIAVALAGYLIFIRAPHRLLQQELPRYQRLSEEARRIGRQPFE